MALKSPACFFPECPDVTFHQHQRTPTSTNNSMSSMGKEIRCYSAVEQQIFDSSMFTIVLCQMCSGLLHCIIWYGSIYHVYYQKDAEGFMI